MFEYEVNKGVSETIVSIKLEENVQLDEFRYRMLRENHIEGIISMKRKIEDEKLVYDYDITGMKSIENKFQGQAISYGEIRNLYTTMITILEQAEDYFLDKSSFIITKQFVCFLENKGYQFFYCPEYQKDIKLQLVDFTEYIMDKVDYQDRRAVELSYEIFRIVREPHTTIKEILEYIQYGRKKSEQLLGRSVESVKKQSVPMQMPMQQISAASACAPQKKEEKKEPGSKEGEFSSKKLLLCTAAVSVGIILFLGCYFSGILYMSHSTKLDTTKLVAVVLLVVCCVGYVCYRIYDKEEEIKEKSEKKKEKGKEDPEVEKKREPIVMKYLQEPAPVRNQGSMSFEYAACQNVVEESNNEELAGNRFMLVEADASTPRQFVIYKTPYILGKAAEQVDGIIYSDAVSRVHAEFIREGNTIYVIDMHSTNGTYVNKQRIQSNQKIAVHNGDHIMIADREYRLIS